jgi:hypothetical protein
MTDATVEMMKPRGIGVPLAGGRQVVTVAPGVAQTLPVSTKGT